MHINGATVHYQLSELPASFSDAMLVPGMSEKEW